MVFRKAAEGTRPACSRRDLLKRGAVVGAGLVAANALLTTREPAQAQAQMAGGDAQILTAALIAEALATTMYTQVLQAPFFTSRIVEFQRPYFTAARDQEMAHVSLLQGALNLTAPPVTAFYYPRGMFTDEKVFFATLLALEEAFIAAYIVGAAQLSTPALRTAAGRILGIEAEHRALGRLVARDLGLEAPDGKSFQPPNNLCFEKTLNFADISGAVTALTPFIDRPAAESAGFDTASFEFAAFTPSCPDDET